jgi:hypothetical protein
MKKYGDVEVSFHALLNSALEFIGQSLWSGEGTSGGWSRSQYGRFRVEKTPLRLSRNKHRILGLPACSLDSISTRNFKIYYFVIQ